MTCPKMLKVLKKIERQKQVQNLDIQQKEIPEGNDRENGKEITFEEI